MPQKNTPDLVATDADDPAAATASRRSGSKKRGTRRGQATSAPAVPPSEANAGQDASSALAPLDAEQPASVPDADPPEPGRSFPGAFLPGAVAANTVGVTAVVSTVTLDPGLSVIEISIPPTESYTVGQVSLPLIWLSQPAVSEPDRLKILTLSGRDDNWLPPPGDLIVVRSPAAGGQLTVTVFGPPGQPGQTASIVVHRLSRSDPAPVTAAPAAVFAGATRRREVRLEVLAHIERRGDQVFPGERWAGTHGSRLRIEGFMIQPLGELAPSDIEYRLLGADGGESPWVQSPQFCGARGRRLRLTGFAVRMAPQLQDRFEVEYSGAFFDSGVSGPFKDGDVCRPILPGDTLEAINVRVIRRD